MLRWNLHTWLQQLVKCTHWKTWPSRPSLEQVTSLVAIKAVGICGIPPQEHYIAKQGIHLEFQFITKVYSGVEIRAMQATQNNNAVRTQCMRPCRSLECLVSPSCHPWAWASHGLPPGRLLALAQLFRQHHQLLVFSLLVRLIRNRSISLWCWLS